MMTTQDQAEREALAAAIEADQREQAKAIAAAQRAAATEAGRLAAEQVVQTREQAEWDAREAAWKAKVGSIAFGNRIRRETAEARAAFDKAVLEDFAHAPQAYFAWTDALYRSHFLGVEPLTDIPHFAEAVDRLLYAAAPKRSDAVEAAVRAERYGGD